MNYPRRTFWSSNTLDMDWPEDYDDEIGPMKGEYRRAGDSFDEAIFAPLISSLGEDGRHYPIIDLDIPHHYESSSTEGHGHLFIDIPMDWTEVTYLLTALAEVRIVTEGWKFFAEENKQIFIRKSAWKKGDWAHAVLDALIPSLLGARLDKTPDPF